MSFLSLIFFINKMELKILSYRVDMTIKMRGVDKDLVHGPPLAVCIDSINVSSLSSHCGQGFSLFQTVLLKIYFPSFFS